MDIPLQLDRRPSRAPAARRVSAIPERRMALLRGSVQHERGVLAVCRALASGRRPRDVEEEQGREGGVSCVLSFESIYCLLGTRRSVGVWADVRSRVRYRRMGEVSILRLAVFGQDGSILPDVSHKSP